MWLSAFAWNYWSALSYYQFIFGDVVGKGRWGWDKIVVYILHGLVLLWYISSVSHQVPLPHECWLTASRSFLLCSNTDYKLTSIGSLVQTQLMRLGSGTPISSTSSSTFRFYFFPLYGLEDLDINDRPGSYICYSSFQVACEWWERLFVASPLAFFWGFSIASRTKAQILLSHRTTGISIYRLWLLDKRFGASAAGRYELAILAVMCSVVEANLANICTNIPTIGYQVFFAWYREKLHGTIDAETARQRTIGFDPIPGYEQHELNDMAEQHRPLKLRSIE